jgi:diguanylate cyclase
VNDNHGHDTGDRVLKFVGSLLAKVSGEKCHVARHGGEEFVMLFRGKTVGEACEIVDDTRKDLASRNLVDRNTGERMDTISFSGGVADVFAYEDPRAALKAADRALYLAKEHGRNRIYMAADA